MRPFAEGLFITAARLCGLVAAFLPLALLAAILAALLTAGWSLPPGVFLSELLLRLGVTVVSALAGALAGATAGIGTALFAHELSSGILARACRIAPRLAAAVPTVVVGWFAAVVLLPLLGSRSFIAVLVLGSAVVAVCVMSRAYVLALRAFQALPVSMREAAVALGLDASRLTSNVILPASRRRLLGVYVDALSRGIGEATALSILFLSAVRMGYDVKAFSVSAEMLTDVRIGHAFDSGLALSALLIFALCACSRVVSSRLIGQFEWA